MDNWLVLRWLEGFIPPAAFLGVLWVLLEPKESRRSARWVLAGLLAAVQVVICVLGDSPELAFTLLPLSFYLPAIIGAHLLSQYPFLSTAVGWLFALLCQELLMTAQKLLVLLGSESYGPAWPWIFNGIMLLAAAGTVLAVYRFFQKPFRACAGDMGEDWASILFLPVMLLALYSLT